MNTSLANLQAELKVVKLEKAVLANKQKDIEEKIQIENSKQTRKMYFCWDCPEDLRDDIPRNVWILAKFRFHAEKFGWLYTKIKEGGGLACIFYDSGGQWSLTTSWRLDDIVETCIVPLHFAEHLDSNLAILVHNAAAWRHAHYKSDKVYVKFLEPIKGLKAGLYAQGGR